ncbi:hypothetical protein G7Y89_g4893 [Cudoniella acicularis]|uniref:Uncharacterized protein n=1 Tax=Cudoniella acicularis TaxID=354080 RepID=A0A8H4RNJ2_9HELO|nr:hypothetical protein G7Y89_g4893 [Cudoniella acicularis]
MRRQRAICLFCRHTLNSQSRNASVSTPFAARRWLAQSSEPYILSRLVIDLDAVDNEQVQKFEDMPKEEQENQLGLTPPAQRIPSETKIEPPAQEAVLPLRAIRPEPPDLLSYALLGDPVLSMEPQKNTPRNINLQQLFKSRMIQPQDTLEEKIIQLTLGFTTNPLERLEAAGFTSMKKKKIIMHDLSLNNRFPVLRRLIGRLSTTTEGCELLLQRNSKAIINGIKACRTWSHGHEYRAKVTSAMVLDMLNSFTLNVASRNLKIGSDLCLTALYYASKANNIPSVIRYLEMSREISCDWNHPAAVAALVSLQHNFVKELPFSYSWMAWKDDAFKRREIAKLITGWSLGDRPDKAVARKLSFAFNATPNLSAAPFTLYTRYILGLGEMGFHHGLWSEWQSHLEIARETTTPLFGSYLFAMAMVLAKEPERAQDILKVFSALATTEQKGEAHRFLSRLIQAHYEFHHLIPSQSILNCLNGGMPGDPAKAVLWLEKLLCVDYPKFVPITDLVVNFGTLEDRAGLLVMPSHGHNPIYFKPTGERTTPEEL